MDININLSTENCNDGIFNNDQGYFRNITSNQITTSPTLNLAALSNCCGDKSPDVTISLNTIYLSWTDFSTLFFKSLLSILVLLIAMLAPLVSTIKRMKQHIIKMLFLI